MRLNKLLSIATLLVVVSIVSSSFALVKIPSKSNCMMVVTYSEMAGLQLKKVAKASSVDKAKKFVKKGMEQALQASAYAPQCNCNLAETYALEAYTFAKKANEATELEDMKAQAKKAAALSFDAMGAAQTCNK